jgi:UDP-N-acetylmuramoylalanine--D-glutamate ligase
MKPVKQRLVVLGGGESGVGAALLGVRKGYEVFVSDKGKVAEKYQAELNELGIDWEMEKHTEDKILNADLIVKSPGIPDKAPLIQQLKSMQIPVVSEIEFAAMHTQTTCVGITGSNGKTTTTMLTHRILKDGGLDVAVAGNIGSSFAREVASEDKPFAVVEISSFQLDDIVTFRPHIAIMTNITPDHLDRYEYKFEKYIESKFRITMNQTEKDYLIYDGDDEVIADWLSKNETRAKKIPFSIKKKLNYGTYINNQSIMINISEERISISQDELALEGKHNLKNAMAASTVAHLLKIRKESIRHSLSVFEGVPHRLEKVKKVDGVTYINDSKATNVNSTFYALESVQTQIVWIVGGQDKGNDYHELLPMVNQKVKAIICLGIDNAKIIDTFQNTVELMAETHSMQEAVKMAYQLSESGDTVLLSPACASFDLFRNYEDRGDQFKEAVKKL